MLAGDSALSARDGYDRAALLFQWGQLANCEHLASDLAERAGKRDAEWAAKLRILAAEAAIWRGTSSTALALLESQTPVVDDREIQVRRLALIALADSHLHKPRDANQRIEEASALCSGRELSACASLIAAQAAVAMESGDYERASRFYSNELMLARKFGERFEEATVLGNLAVICMTREQYDQAIDLLNVSNDLARGLSAKDILLNNTGNLGWAYYSLGDAARALPMFQEAERDAADLGDIDDVIVWLITTGYVFQDRQEFARALDSYREALSMATKANNRDKITNVLEDLAYVSIDSGRLDEADGYVRQLDPLIEASGNRLDAEYVALARGRIAAGRRQDQVAEGLFRQVEGDPASQVTMRLGAEHELARLFEAEGRPEDARNEYVTALGTFEAARAEIKNEDSKLPYLTNATPIYDDYIRLLVSQGKSKEALAVADQSRARTLEQGLVLSPGANGKASPKGDAEALRADRAGAGSIAQRPEAIAARAGATLLFYWLGEKQSWLWAITPRKTAVFALPAKHEIAATVERYRQELLGPEDPLRAQNVDGRALYRMLVAPAKDLVARGGRVVVLCDGELSELNFETLLVDAPDTHDGLHYWIEDADVVSAPSLRMVAARAQSGATKGRLLLVGDAVSPGPDYPELPNAPVEMREIRKHFPPQDATVLARDGATAAAYVRSDPRRFAYIDFVAHGVASRTDPLDSAIILSRTPGLPRTGAGPQGGEDSFKLYAREIMQHPLDARLVTIAACYGGGTRSYAGEGLVGLSWAFLRAGAHNVIGALWEVSDESAPRLMDALYQGLQDGLPPDAALRAAKLKLLHGTGPEGGEFRRPFYWGSFQLYTN